jgi:crossover junction endodeoxyribonuclease RuvC
MTADRGAVVILGIDPGSRITGYGVIAIARHKVSYLASGCIEVGELAFAERLCAIFEALTEIIRQHQPREAAMEKVFMSRNADSALKLGQARGAALVAVARQGVQLSEYSPNQVKQAIVGRGHADKGQVQHMVCMLLGLSTAPRADAADALALAMCHGHTREGQLAVRVATGRVR